MMILNRSLVSRRSRYLSDKVTLRRLGAPLLYAYDACTFLRRLRGLHAVPPLGLTDALIIRPCKAIHTYGLDRTIDVIFMDRSGKILKVDSIAPQKLMFCWRASVAVEMRHGTAARLGLKVGQRFLPCKGWWF